MAMFGQPPVQGDAPPVGSPPPATPPQGAPNGPQGPQGPQNDVQKSPMAQLIFALMQDPQMRALIEQLLAQRQGGQAPPPGMPGQPPMPMPLPPMANHPPLPPMPNSPAPTPGPFTQALMQRGR